MALGKARNDINRIAIRNGIKVRNIICRRYKIPMLSTLNALRQYLSVIFDGANTDEVVVQYPVFAGIKAYQIARRLFHWKYKKVTLLIHDIGFFRSEKDRTEEVRILNEADKIIVHTQAMADALRTAGVQSHMQILTLFDYLTDDDFKSDEDMVKNKKVVIFAGNLKKSKFLPDLCNFDFGDISFNLYGLKEADMNFANFKGKRYCGFFDSEHTAQITGGWGLVWDGDSIDSCCGTLGNYLRYNLPHKLSLYIASGIPVIVWKDSAVAKYVQENRIGIVVNSLKEIPQTIDAFLDSDYLSLVSNCRKIGTLLRNGAMTLKALEL